MNRDVVAVALAVALWVAGPLVVLEAVTGVGVSPWPTLSTAVAAVVGLTVLLGLRSGSLSVERLWSRWPVRAAVGGASTAAGIGIVAVAELLVSTTASIIVAGLVGIALLTVGAAGIVTILGRANRRRIETEREIATLGRPLRAPGRWARALWAGIALAQFGLAGSWLASAGGSHAVFAVAQGVAFLGLAATSTARARTWEVGERGLVGGVVEHPWAAVETVRIDGGTVRVRLDSRWRALGWTGLRRSLRFSREGVDERAVELLATHAKTIGDRRQYGDTAEY